MRWRGLRYSTDLYCMSGYIRMLDLVDARR